MNLRTAFIRLAHENPETRSTLLPLVKQADKWETMPKGWTDKSRKQFWETLTGDVKHKVTKCIKEMEGKFDDPGAFCASLADRVDPGWRSRTASSDRALRSKLIRLAHEKPELRPALLPLLKSAADFASLSRAANKASVEALQLGFGQATPETRRAHLDAAKAHSAAYKEAISERRKVKDAPGPDSGDREFELNELALHHHNSARMHRTLASANENFTERSRDRLLVDFRRRLVNYAADPSRLASLKEAATVNPQPFGRGEWNTYSGATSFADGSDPIFAAATLEATIVADAGGIQLMLMGDDSTTDTIYQMNASFSSQKDAIRAAQSALRLIRTGRIPPGFKPL
jgi:hypothetical protein